MTSKQNKAFAKRYGITIGDDIKKGQLPLSANAKVRKKVLRVLWMKSAYRNQKFSSWKNSTVTADD